MRGLTERTRPRGTLRRRPTAVSLFTGCGGSDLGLIEAGFDVVMANDILAYARDVYLANLPEADYLLSDASEIKSFPAVDLLCGCYPCQGFSQGGSREPGRTTNYLYRAFDRALRMIRPKAFIVENVSGMIRADFQHLLQNQLVRFRTAGYRVSYSLMDATEVGVAQKRRRLFFVGIRSDLNERYEFPKPSDLNGGPVKSTTVRDAIGHMPIWPTGEFDQQPFHWYYMSRNRRCSWDDMSPTIVANSRHMPLHPMSPALVKLGRDKWAFSTSAPARRFSYREAAVLQGFPDDLIFPDTCGMGLRYRVIGNAVPPPLFRSVAAALPDVWS